MRAAASMATSSVAWYSSGMSCASSPTTLVLASRDLPRVLRAAVPCMVVSGTVVGVPARGDCTPGVDAAGVRLGDDETAITRRGLLRLAGVAEARGAAGVEVRVRTLWRRRAAAEFGAAWLPMAHCAKATVLSAMTLTAGEAAAGLARAMVASHTPSGVPWLGVLKRTALSTTSAAGVSATVASQGGMLLLAVFGSGIAARGTVGVASARCTPLEALLQTVSSTCCGVDCAGCSGSCIQSVRYQLCNTKVSYRVGRIDELIDDGARKVGIVHLDHCAVLELE